jgi:hypothetical protein
MSRSASETGVIFDRPGKGPGFRRSLGRQSALLFALLAIAVQAFVVQTHVHFISQYGWTPPVHGAAEPATASIGDDELGLTQQEALAACPVCQAQATGGRADLSIGPLLPVLAERIPALIVAQAFVRELGAVSHIWRSRAPPIL